MPGPPLRDEVEGRDGKQRGEGKQRGGTYRERETNKSGVSSGYGLVREARLADRRGSGPKDTEVWALPHGKQEPTGREEGRAGVAASPGGCVPPARLPTVSGACWAPPARRWGSTDVAQGLRGSAGVCLSRSAPPAQGNLPQQRRRRFVCRAGRTQPFCLQRPGRRAGFDLEHRGSGHPLKPLHQPTSAQRGTDLGKQQREVRRLLPRPRDGQQACCRLLPQALQAGQPSVDRGSPGTEFSIIAEPSRHGSLSQSIPDRSEQSSR